MNARRWKLTAKGYVQCEERVAGKWRSIRLHRLLLGLEHGDPRQGDHINRDKLDNRRENLRIVSDAEQRQNVPARGGTSAFRGVSFHRGIGRWTAKVGRVHVGVFGSEDEANVAARAARARLMPAAVD